MMLHGDGAHDEVNKTAEEMAPNGGLVIGDEDGVRHHKDGLSDNMMQPFKSNRKSHNTSSSPSFYSSLVVCVSLMWCNPQKKDSGSQQNLFCQNHGLIALKVVPDL